MPGPDQLPIAEALARTAKAVKRAFDDRLSEAGGSLPVWLVLLSLHTLRLRNQRELARAVGIESATLTHHLNRMERDGLVTRYRDPANRRVHVVDLTEDGRAAFERLRAAAAAHDRQVRAGFSADELVGLRDVLERLRANVVDSPPPDPGEG